MQRKIKPIPLVDLFAGPGGLGEGFSSVRRGSGEPAFKIVLSIEKDQAAHQTLELRSFFRQFRSSDVPEDYYLHLQGRLSRDQLFKKHAVAAAAARSESWNAELGKVDPKKADDKIRAAISGSSSWILCGGPPCQAYSLIGRSRNGGIDPNDHRVFLYKEYLRILAEHRPSIFVFENVKGLLSSKLGKQGIFRQILSDLTAPHEATGAGTPVRYHLFPLTAQSKARTEDGRSEYDSCDFIIKCEDFGIPQSRHRIILIGVRSDLAPARIPILQTYERHISASEVLSGLPRLRSGLSRTNDGKDEWRRALNGIREDGILDDIPNGNGSILRAEIRWILKHLKIPRFGRGGEFLSYQATSRYKSRWYCDKRLNGVCNHSSRPHMVEDLYRYLYAASYAKLLKISPELRDFPSGLLPKHKNVLDEKKQEYFDDRFRVQLGDKPATTITSHIAKDGHYYIHYDEKQCRSLTVREAARLQTFPDNYMFCGSRTEQYIQVGNAVPPLLATQIARVVEQVATACYGTPDQQRLPLVFDPEPVNNQSAELGSR